MIKTLDTRGNPNLKRREKGLQEGREGTDLKQQNGTEVPERGVQEVVITLRVFSSQRTVIKTSGETTKNYFSRSRWKQDSFKYHSVLGSFKNNYEHLFLQYSLKPETRQETRWRIPFHTVSVFQQKNRQYQAKPIYCQVVFSAILELTDRK